jgi:hypothetical protein
VGIKRTASNHDFGLKTFNAPVIDSDASTSIALNEVLKSQIQCQKESSDSNSALLKLLQKQLSHSAIAVDAPKFETTSAYKPVRNGQSSEDFTTAFSTSNESAYKNLFGGNQQMPPPVDNLSLLKGQHPAHAKLTQTTPRNCTDPIKHDCIA